MSRKTIRGVSEDWPLLGEGSMGRVYGPMTAARLRRAYLSLTGVPLVVQQQKRGILYVVKVSKTIHQPPLDALFYKCVSATGSDRLIIPLYTHRTRNGALVEVQEYGGVEFADVLEDVSMEWTDDMVWTLWKSMTEILETCLLLIRRYGYFLLDIKPRNMVWTAEKGLRLIDVEHIPTPKILTHTAHPMVFTLDPMSLPIQFIKVYATETASTFFKEYGRRWTKEAAELNRKRLSLLLKEMPSEWSPEMVNRLAFFCVAYPLMIAWQLLSPRFYRTADSPVLDNMNSIAAVFFSRRLGFHGEEMVHFMKKVRRKNFPSLLQKQQEHQFPQPKREKDTVIYDDYFKA